MQPRTWPLHQSGRVNDFYILRGTRTPAWPAGSVGASATRGLAPGLSECRSLPADDIRFWQRGQISQVVSAGESEPGGSSGQLKIWGGESREFFRAFHTSLSSVWLYSGGATTGQLRVHRPQRNSGGPVRLLKKRRPERPSPWDRTTCHPGRVSSDPIFGSNAPPYFKSQYARSRDTRVSAFQSGNSTTASVSSPPTRRSEGDRGVLRPRNVPSENHIKLLGPQTFPFAVAA